MKINLMLGDCLERMKEIPDGSVDMIISSPPYNIGKEYEKKIGISDYLDWHLKIIENCYRCLKDGGSIFWQVGNYIDSGKVYPIDCLTFGQFTDLGLSPRNRIIWHFGHGLHCKKRFSGRHESVMWFTKGDDYYFNVDPVRVPSKYPLKKHYKGPKKGQLSGNPLGKNPSDVWDIPNVKHNHPEKTSHPCQYPEELVRRCVASSTIECGVVFDPFMGSGTTGTVAANLNRKFIGIELDQGYFDIAKKRIEEAHE